MAESKKSKPTKQAVTQLLKATRAGDKEAVNELLPYVYDEMRNIAHKKLRFERNGHTLDTTALVHETYFKLINHDEIEWQSRAHFLAVAAMAMKRVLINYAERRNAVKRGGEYSRVDIAEFADNDIKSMSEAMAEQILVLERAMQKMKKFNERGCQVVEYHFFGGLTWKEISEVMGLAPVTVRRAWYAARLWLRRELQRSDLPDIVVQRSE